MDLDPMMATSQDDYSYFDYDNRPIRPMNQEALNETLARLPILIDDDENRADGSSCDSNTSIKSHRLTNRRQPVLAHSTRRKKNATAPASNSILTNNQSLLHVNTTVGTPKSNKRKLGRCTPTVTPSANKVIKQIDCRQELAQLKEENKLLEEAKINLELECALLKTTHETELDTLKQEHEQTIATLVQMHKLECEKFETCLAEKEQLLIQTNDEFDALRNTHSILLLEKETLDKMVIEYRLLKEEMTGKLCEDETTIKQLREEIENMKKIQEQQQQKQSTARSTLAAGRMPLKGSTSDRPRTAGSAVTTSTKNDPARSKTNAKISITRVTKKNDTSTTPSSSVNTSLNKSTSSTCSSVSTMKPPLSKAKETVLIIEKKKLPPSAPPIDKRVSLISTRTRSKAIPTK